MIPSEKVTPKTGPNTYLSTLISSKASESRGKIRPSISESEPSNLISVVKVEVSEASTNSKLQRSGQLELDSHANMVVLGKD